MQVVEFAENTERGLFVQFGKGLVYSVEGDSMATIEGMSERQKKNQCQESQAGVGWAG